MFDFFDEKVLDAASFHKSDKSLSFLIFFQKRFSELLKFVLLKVVTVSAMVTSICVKKEVFLPSLR